MNKWGLPYYLPIVCWRVDQRLRAKRAGETRPHMFVKWLMALREWTKNPLEGFDQRVRLAQVWEDDGEDEEDEDGGDVSSDDKSDDEVSESVGRS